MNIIFKENAKEIQETLMEVQAIQLQQNDLLQLEWQTLHKAQRLLNDKEEDEQLKLFK